MPVGPEINAILTIMTDIQRIMYSLPQAEGEKVDAILKDDTLWMTQKAMSKVFDVEVSSISRHITNIIATEELTEKSNLQKMQIAISDKPVTLYSLDMAIAVGYRVNSARATKFRIWATGVLKEYLTKGFVLDDERLKNGNRIFSKDYFRSSFHTPLHLTSWYL